MLKHLYDLEKRTLKLNLGEEVVKDIEFDLIVDSVTIIVPATGDRMVMNKYFCHMNALDLPYRNEDNGSKFITLEEITRYVLSNLNLSNFEVRFESARFGAVFNYGNYEEGKWTLHAITNGYS